MTNQIEKQVDDIMEDLIVGHNFEYAGQALKDLFTTHNANYVHVCKTCITCGKCGLECEHAPKFTITTSSDNSAKDINVLSKSEGSDEELFKSTILRPLADRFGELSRQIDSGEYELPETIEAAEKITESYIEQAWQRVLQRDTTRDKAILAALRADLNNFTARHDKEYVEWTQDFLDLFEGIEKENTNG